MANTKSLMPWDTLTTAQKRHRIFSVTTSSLLRFWVVCGKDRQHYYQREVIIDDNTVDTVRDKLSKEYIDNLDAKNIGNRDVRIKKLKKLLY